MKGVLRSDYKVVVTEKEAVEELREHNIGTVVGDKLILFEEEYLYLMYHGKLEVVDENGKQYQFEDLMEVLQKRDPKTWFNFLVYYDLRSRGYYVKRGPSRDIPFRLYEKGDVEGAKYHVVTLVEGEQISVPQIMSILEAIQRADKEAIIAVVDANGDVTYYEASVVTLER